MRKNLASVSVESLPRDELFRLAFQADQMKSGGVKSARIGSFGAILALYLAGQTLKWRTLKVAFTGLSTDRRIVRFGRALASSI